MTAELTAVGVPAVLVPLPGAPSDHQTAQRGDARAAGAAVMVPDAELDAARLDRPCSTRCSPTRRGSSAMSAAARALGRPDAAARLADLVEEARP